MAKIIIAMSGGVDSSVAAYLLKSQGHEVIGIFMRNWDSLVNNDILGNPHANNSFCPQEQDYNDAKKVAEQLKIPLLRVDFINEYYNLVFQNLIDEYKKGVTPNPDILCNKFIKFGALINYIEKNFADYDFLATGHYAKILQIDQQIFLTKPKDTNKDQTYFLSQLTSQQLKKVIFPLADLTKNQVRKIAEQQKLFTAFKKDSTGICFIGNRNFTEFLKNYIPAKPGPIIDIETNQKLGVHQGAMYYTIGQRKGLNLGGQKKPYYVAGHDLKQKIVYVTNNFYSDVLTSDKALIVNVNWIVNNYVPKNLTVKFRYKSKEVKAKIKWNYKNLIVLYKERFIAVTPGQHCVFYDNDICLGGGIISRVYLKNRWKKYL